MNKKYLIALGALGVMVVAIISLQHSFLDKKVDSTTHRQVAENNENPVPNQQLSILPSISYQTILENDEFQSGMQAAVKNSDIEAAKALQQKAIEIATAANLPASQINLLSGDSGLHFMQFLAKRQLFSIAFEKRYRELKGIQDLKLIYPEAKDLFARSDELLALRDKQILQIAQQLAGDEDVAPYLKQAREQWLLLNQRVAQ